MEEKVIVSILYDYYGELLTDKQKEYFKYYYFSNLSLQEIADILKISRNAVHKQLKTIIEKLYNYESVLKIYEKDKKILEILDSCNDENIVQEIKQIIE